MKRGITMTLNIFSLANITENITSANKFMFVAMPLMFLAVILLYSTLPRITDKLKTSYEAYERLKNEESDALQTAKINNKKAWTQYQVIKTISFTSLVVSFFFVALAVIEMTTGAIGRIDFSISILPYIICVCSAVLSVVFLMLYKRQLNDFQLYDTVTCRNLLFASMILMYVTIFIIILVHVP